MLRVRKIASCKRHIAIVLFFKSVTYPPPEAEITWIIIYSLVQFLPSRNCIKLFFHAVGCGLNIYHGMRLFNYLLCWLFCLFFFFSFNSCVIKLSLPDLCMLALLFFDFCFDGLTSTGATFFIQIICNFFCYTTTLSPLLLCILVGRIFKYGSTACHYY